MGTISARLKAPSTRQSGNNLLDDEQSCRAGLSLFLHIAGMSRQLGSELSKRKESPDDAGSFSSVGIRRSPRIVGWAKARSRRAHHNMPMHLVVGSLLGLECVTAFSKRIGVSRQWLHDILSGRVPREASLATIST